MGIIGRAQAVLASNFNAVLSRFEEPGRDIALLLSEMKEQVRGAERELIRVMGERKRSEAKLAELDEQIAKWEQRAELAVRHGEDALAREALAQKQRLLGERERLNGNRAEQQQSAIGMKAEIERMKRVHQDYSSRQHTIAAQVSQSRAGGGAAGLGAKPEQNSFEAFERLERAIDTDAAETEAHAELDQLLDQTALGTMTHEQLNEQFRKLEQESAAIASVGSGAAGSIPESIGSAGVGKADAGQTGGTNDATADAESAPHPRIRIEP